MGCKSSVIRHLSLMSEHKFYYRSELRRMTREDLIAIAGSWPSNIDYSKMTTIAIIDLIMDSQPETTFKQDH